MNVDSLTGLLEGGVGAIAVLGIFLTLIMAGRLLTSGNHDEVIDGYKQIIADKDKQLADKDKQISDLTTAYNRQSERADAGIMAAKVAADVVQGLRKATS